MTAVSGTTLNAEANLEFDGSTLTLGGGGAFTGNIDLNSDTNKLKLGAGDDFQFWHNGSSNYIWTNSGPINIQSTQSSGTNGYISFTSGGTTERLRITSAGNVKIASGVIENSNTISANYTVSSNYNAMSAGPMSIASGVSVTVPSGSAWTIV